MSRRPSYFVRPLLNTIFAASSVSALLLAGCAGGTTSTTTPCGSSCVSNPLTSTVIYTLQATSISAAATTILRFDSLQNGNVTPDATITMPTGINAYGMAVDSSGNVYVATNTTTRTSPAVYVYAPSASGAATPTRIVAGSATALTYPESVALDKSGQLYVLNGDGNIQVFAAGAAGNAAPLRTFSAPDSGTSIAADSSGNVYVGGFISSKIYVYGPTATGTATPTATITGAATGIGEVFQLSEDYSNNLYVATSGYTGNSAILVFASGANGNVAPTRSITGSATTFANINAAGIDSGGHIYESDSTNFANLTGPSINIFSAGANGNVAPTAHITSSAWTTGVEGSSVAAF